MSSEYQFIRHLIDRDEQDALRAVDKDLESGQSRLQSLSKMFGQNVDKMTAAKGRLNSILSKADSASFLEVGTVVTNQISAGEMIDICDQESP